MKDDRNVFACGFAVGLRQKIAFEYLDPRSGIAPLQQLFKPRPVSRRLREAHQITKAAIQQTLDNTRANKPARPRDENSISGRDNLICLLSTRIEFRGEIHI